MPRKQKTPADAVEQKFRITKQQHSIVREYCAATGITMVSFWRAILNDWLSANREEIIEAIRTRREQEDAMMGLTLNTDPDASPPDQAA